MLTFPLIEFVSGIASAPRSPLSVVHFSCLSLHDPAGIARGWLLSAEAVLNMDFVSGNVSTCSSKCSNVLLAKRKMGQAYVRSENNCLVDCFSEK